jgi:hypothetical protein
MPSTRLAPWTPGGRNRPAVAALKTPQPGLAVIFTNRRSASLAAGGSGTRAIVAETIARPAASSDDPLGAKDRHSEQNDTATSDDAVDRRDHHGEGEEQASGPPTRPRVRPARPLPPARSGSPEVAGGLRSGHLPPEAVAGRPTREGRQPGRRSAAPLDVGPDPRRAPGHDRQQPPLEPGLDRTRSTPAHRAPEPGVSPAPVEPKASGMRVDVNGHQSRVQRSGVTRRAAERRASGQVVNTHH